MAGKMRHIFIAVVLSILLVSAYIYIQPEHQPKAVLQASKKPEVKEKPPTRPKPVAVVQQPVRPMAEPIQVIEPIKEVTPKLLQKATEQAELAPDLISIFKAPAPKLALVPEEKQKPVEAPKPKAVAVAVAPKKALPAKIKPSVAAKAAVVKKAKPSPTVAAQVTTPVKAAVVPPKRKTATIAPETIGKHVHRTVVVRKEAETNEDKNSFSIIEQLYNVSHEEELRNYTTAQYGRDTKSGPFYLRVNYASRNHHANAQLEAEYFPKINNWLYLDLDVAVAQDLNLFPNWTYIGEAYFTPKVLQFSLGAQYRDLGLVKLDTYTGSLTKRIGNYSATFRPSYYVPSVGQSITLYTLAVYKYFCDDEQFVSLSTGAGKIPDLADLQTVGTIILKDKFVTLGWHLPIRRKETLDLGISYEVQTLPNNSQRDLAGINFSWKTKF